MPYDLTRLPIDRTNRKKGGVIVLALNLPMPLLLALALLANNHWNLALLLTLNGALLLLWTALIAALLFHLWRQNSRLLIDEVGIHLTANGGSKIYAWSDISYIRRLNRGRGGPVAQIIRNGQVHTDEKSDILWGDYGLSLDEIISIVDAGVARWGTPGLRSAADSSAGPFSDADTGAKSAIGLMILWSLLMVGLISPLFVTPFLVRKRDRNMELYGAPATAKVEKIYCGSGKGGCHYMIDYTYDVGGGRTRWGENAITPEQAAGIQQGSDIPIAYDCREPGIVYPNFGNWLHVNPAHATACPAPRR